MDSSNSNNRLMSQTPSALKPAAVQKGQLWVIISKKAQHLWLEVVIVATVVEATVAMSRCSMSNRTSSSKGTLIYSARIEPEE
jgi:hypothetical protein